MEQSPGHGTLSGGLVTLVVGGVDVPDVLNQQHGETWRVVSYASRSLTDVERRYSQTEKEALALVWACEHFNMYVTGLSFELETDHKPLERIYSHLFLRPN